MLSTSHVEAAAATATRELGHEAAAPSTSGQLRMLRNWVEDNIDNAAHAGASAASCTRETTTSR